MSGTPTLDGQTISTLNNLNSTTGLSQILNQGALGAQYSAVQTTQNSEDPQQAKDALTGYATATSVYAGTATADAAGNAIGLQTSINAGVVGASQPVTISSTPVSTSSDANSASAGNQTSTPLSIGGPTSTIDLVKQADGSYGLPPEGALVVGGTTSAGTNLLGSPPLQITDGTNLGSTNTSTFSGVGFYVNSAGVALPMTGYRYMGSQYTAQTQATMTAPLSYFGFTNYSTAGEALDGYQIDPVQNNNNAQLKGSFNTLQLFGADGSVNAVVPLANGNNGPGLEPYTSSYPGLGSGGQAQLVPAIPKTTINLDSATEIPPK